ncbi:MAG: hypothetical protein REJ23_01610 [Brevundimonas sp.]|nr:hypothetical protein [Brevundimonas sp.]
MTYMCFIESDILTVPHMEPLAAASDAAARQEAAQLLEQHRSGFAAHVFLEDRRICTVRAEAG